MTASSSFCSIELISPPPDCLRDWKWIVNSAFDNVLPILRTYKIRFSFMSTAVWLAKSRKANRIERLPHHNRNWKQTGLVWPIPRMSREKPRIISDNMMSRFQFSQYGGSVKNYYYELLMKCLAKLVKLLIGSRIGKDRTYYFITFSLMF